ncbi:asparagine synthase (glutamine-hydrolyzing) [Streptomyces sp. CB03238]|uniref:asparagine synthase (glutamine-hydrolyzing) n=1 Tax=Streptomyces sp. CB03238 TaxID=1907777 RepID=UPI000A11E5B2|nr:asparagine synthase (glutamine-hydrolyzing) [Streptomyces sp. CB03238]ORT56078.1 asparagine synthase (glutamine-hydrolyzing) [Streptomyces sp. CB03238]
MCGIVVAVDPDGSLGPDSVAPALRVLRPRGPDGEGVWASPTGRAVLGHTRLAVNDPDGGAQPMGTPDGEQWLVANGEFYGHRELRDRLRRLGVPVRSGSDSEVALHLFHAHGERALNELRGEFAFVVWDERRGRLTAVRDRFGVKPLYHARLGRRLLIASEIKALLALGVSPEWDTAAFADHLHLAMGPDATPVRAVRQIPPGCLLRADAGGVRVHRYWDIDYPRADEFPGVPEEERPAHLEEVEAALSRAVHRRTDVDGPLACHLSGGLDSSSVLALAARGRDVTAFTVAFDGSALDESALARRTADHMGVRHHVVHHSADDHITALVDTLHAGEMVQENAHGVARFAHAGAIAASGHRVALAGEGGDEVLAGYPQFAKDLALTLDPAQLARTRSAYAKLTATADVPHHLRTLVTGLGFVPAWIVERHATVARPIAPLLTPEFTRLFRERDSATALLADVGERLAGRTPFHQSLHLFARSRLANYILTAERLDAAQGIEVRLPFFDEDFFDVVRRTPPQWYAHDGRPKHLLRATVGRRLPAEVRDGSKRGFFAPPAAADEVAFAALCDVLDRPALDDSPFFDRRAVLAWLDRLRALPAARRAAHDPILQMIAGTILLTEVFRQAGLAAHGRSARV